MVLRGDLRLDRSSLDVFQKSGGLTDTQPTVTVNVLVTF